MFPSVCGVFLPSKTGFYMTFSRFLVEVLEFFTISSYAFTSYNLSFFIDPRTFSIESGLSILHFSKLDIICSQYCSFWVCRGIFSPFLVTLSLAGPHSAFLLMPYNLRQDRFLLSFIANCTFCTTSNLNFLRVSFK